MKQKQYAPMSVAEQSLSIYAVDKGYMDDVPVSKIGPFEAGLHAHFVNTQGELSDRITQTGAWDDSIENTFKQVIAEFKQTGSW
jgi:F-type H+-transporting ATPase subunit alpha